MLRIHEGTAEWLLPSHLREPPRATSQSRITRRGRKTPVSLTNYSQIINHLLSTYAAEEVLAQAEADLTRLFQADRMLEV